MTTKIGRLRHRIQLLRNNAIPQKSQTSDGSRVDDWTTVATVWGEFLELRGREYLAAQEAHSEVDAKFRIRYRSDVKADWRIIVNGRTFEVVSPCDLMGRRRELELLAKEIR